MKIGFLRTDIGILSYLKKLISFGLCNTLKVIKVKHVSLDLSTNIFAFAYSDVVISWLIDFIFQNYVIY